MLRKCAMLLASAFIGMLAVSSIAQEGKSARGAADAASKSPLQKIMIKMEDQTKAILKMTSSATRFKKEADKGKKIEPIAEDLKKLGAETRKFTEPAQTQKKPLSKWNSMTDQYIAACDDMLKISKKGDFQEIRKSFKSLELSCSNCHGAFRPKTGGDDFGNP